HEQEEEEGHEPEADARLEEIEARRRLAREPRRPPIAVPAAPEVLESAPDGVVVRARVPLLADLAVGPHDPDRRGVADRAPEGRPELPLGPAEHLELREDLGRPLPGA